MDVEKIKSFRKKMEQMECHMSWRMKEEVSCCGITLAQSQVIVELGNAREVCSVELADLLGIDSSTLSRTANRMVEAGLIDRITNCSDRRYVSLTLTSKGQELYHYIEDKGNSYYAKVLDYIPENKREQVLESLILFADALKDCKECSNEEC